MMEDGMTLTAENAVTTNHEFVTQFAKFRASDQPFTHEIQQLSFGPDIVQFVDLNLNKNSTGKPARVAIPQTPIELRNPDCFAPKCPEKPCYISTNTSFHAGEANFDKIKEKIENALISLEDYDWSYFIHDCMWKVKYFHGSSLREKYIYCYWDSKVEDHLIEVKRVRGDGVNLKSSVDFFSKLKSVVTDAPDELSHNKRRNLGGPLPLPQLAAVSNKPAMSLPLPSISSASSSAAAPATGMPKLPLPKLSRGGLAPLPLLGLRGGQTAAVVGGGVVEITQEQFLAGVKPIFSMATDQFFEPRLEAAKMLCDLATKEKKYLELVECQELCMKALDVLLLDEFEEVRQFAVMAFASFVELDCYKKHCLQLRGLDSLLHLIRNSPREVPSYLTAQMRRKAALGMSLLARSYPKEIGEHLMKNVGYSSEQSWLDHCATILDKRTRDAAMELKRCYQV